MAAIAIKLFSVLTLHTSLISAKNSLHCDYHGNCLCPEDVLTFVCRVSDGAATTWKGSIFNCPGNRNEILLRHLTFEDGVAKSCNDGAIIAHSIDVSNNSYTSQLNVTVSLEMHNGTVECIQNGPGIHITSVGTCTLILAAEPPRDARISTINSNQFAINWSPPASNCPAMTYNITTTDCGVCPDITSNTFITCTSLTVNGRVCSVVIQTMACGNSSQAGGAANLAILLKAPSAPNVTARWTNPLGSILTNFNETEHFYISDGIDGSATSYTIIYSDATSGRICDSVVISPSTCIDGQCNHTFNVPSVCSDITSIAISVFATSILGNGPSSEQFLLKFNRTFTYNQGTSNTITLYSAVGGSFFAVLLFLMLVIIIMISFLKKIYISFQGPSSNPEQNTYSYPEPVPRSDEIESIGAYTDLVQPVIDNNKPCNELYEKFRIMTIQVTESCEVTEECIIYENTYHEIDKTLNLDNLLIQIRDQVTPKWNQFGLAIGINKERLDEFSNFPPEECIAEISDLWLRTNETTITWRDVADALKRIGCHRLAERILKVYKTGTLPEGTAEPMEKSSMISDDEDSISELSNLPDQPPLPPRTYQSTS